MKLTKKHKIDIMRGTLDSLYKSKIKKLNKIYQEEITDIVLNMPENKGAIALFNKNKKAYPFMFNTSQGFHLYYYTKSKTTNKEDLAQILNIKNLITNELKGDIGYAKEDPTSRNYSYSTYTAHSTRIYGDAIIIMLPYPLPLLDTGVNNVKFPKLTPILKKYKAALDALAKDVADTIQLMNNILNAVTTLKKLEEIAPDLIKFAPKEPPKEIRLVPLESAQRLARQFSNNRDGK